MGALVRGQDGQLGMTVRNDGTHASGPLTATVSLPPGVRADDVSGDGWSIAGARAGAAMRPISLNTVTLRGPDLAAGASSYTYLRVTVSDTASYGEQPSLLVHGSLPDPDPAGVVYGGHGVQPTGRPATVAMSGHLSVIGAGNTFLSCPMEVLRCAQARHAPVTDTSNPATDANYWKLSPLLGDSTMGAASSAVSVPLPAGSRVVWAGLYWSGTSGSAGDGPVVMRQGSAGARSTIRPDESVTGASGYQAYADVTRVVRSGGTWWVGSDSAPVAGNAAWSGWSVLAIIERPSLPVSQAAVFDGATALPVGGASTIPIGDLPAGSATVQTTAWGGDRHLTGDSITVDGRDLTASAGAACGPDGCQNMEYSVADGAVGDRPGKPWNTFGVDVHGYSLDVPVLPVSQQHWITATSGADAFTLGPIAIAVTEPR